MLHNITVIVTLTSDELTTLDQAVADYQTWNKKNTVGGMGEFVPQEATRETCLRYWISERLVDARLGQGKRVRNKKAHHAA